MKYYLLLLFAFSVLSSCTTIQFRSQVEPSEVTDLQYIESFSYISLIESGNKLKLNDTISKKSEKLVIQTIEEFGDKIPLTSMISVLDTNIKNKLEMEVDFLCFAAQQDKHIEKVKITPIIDSLLEAKGKRFGLITVASGFTRANGNYGEEIAKGIAMGFLTLGMYYQTPIKSHSTMCVLIVDSKDKNLAFFAKSSLKETDPLDGAALKQQLFELFEGYFWQSDYYYD